MTTIANEILEGHLIITGVVVAIGLIQGTTEGMMIDDNLISMEGGGVITTAAIAAGSKGIIISLRRGTIEANIGRRLGGLSQRKRKLQGIDLFLKTLPITARKTSLTNTARPTKSALI